MDSKIPDEIISEAVSHRLAAHSDWGMSESEWRSLLRELIDRMEERAAVESGWVYSDLVEGTLLQGRSDWHHAIAAVLAVAAEAVHRSDLPMLTSVVWGKVSGSPGPGFNSAAKHLGRQRHDEDDLAFWVTELKRVHQEWAILR